ncbi:hypothetical protein OSB04_023675 [Centaurea solstitialis]|uniref:BED-type domain-containing protein n=1 Tax=Centaurea solstitialis TaxID=347529 RepID=A0AA38T4A3_9ASTR|nr:hypothetical protein OSB04_023675 [Centaurea solstitialis]
MVDEQHDPNDQIAEIITNHGRRAEVWKHFNIAILVTGKRKAQCKGCGGLLTSEENSTLKRHIENSCAALKANIGPNQPILDNTGQVWMYSADLCRQMTTQCVIQSAMSFRSFTNPHLTKLIQKALQPRYNPVSRQTLRRNDTASDLSFSTERIRLFNVNFQRLFDHYKNIYGGGSQHQTSQMFSSGSSSSSHRQNRADLMTNLMNEVMNESNKKSRFDTSSLSELNIYIRTSFISASPTPVTSFEEIDILDFWKKKQHQFPILACMARDILTIQASTVASESAFSFSGRILSIRRTRLSLESLEMVVCLKDYLDAVDRVQDQTSIEQIWEIMKIIFTKMKRFINHVKTKLTQPPPSTADTATFHQRCRHLPPTVVFAHLRPILYIAACELIGGDESIAMPAACAARSERRENPKTWWSSPETRSWRSLSNMSQVPSLATSTTTSH